jgi:hypothetical protein
MPANNVAFWAKLPEPFPAQQACVDACRVKKQTAACRNSYRAAPFAKSSHPGFENNKYGP